MIKAANFRDLSRVDEFIDDEEIIEAEEFFFEERRVYIGMIHEGILNIFAGASGNSHTAEV